MGSGWPLTGRAEELQAIIGCVDTAGAGIVLAGAAGVGKTRLAREALTRAGQRGRGYRFVMATTSAQSVPLGAFADYADRLGPDPLARVRDVVDAVTCTANRGRVVVAVDDAHLLDDQSALVVHQIVRRHLATLVLTVRTGEAAPDAITALWKDGLLPRLEVQPLSTAETGSLLTTVLGGPVESSTAERVWRYTRGNALYLRQMVADELAAGRFTQRSGLWIWETHLRVSPTLAELIDTTIGRQPERVTGVLDILAVADPLELDVLAAVSDPAAVNDAEIAGLITVDTQADPPMARLAHPMFGEVRRTRAGTMRLRQLRSTVAAHSPPLDDPPDPVSLVRRAVLLADSDTPACPDLLADGATAALRLRDATTAERLARKAVDGGGGERAMGIHVSALARCDRLHEALEVNSALIDAAPTETDRVVLKASRAAILSRNWEIDRAAAELDSIRGTAAELGLMRPCNCLAAVLEAVRGHAQDAIDLATAGLAGTGWINDSFELLGAIGLVAGLRELGRVDEIPKVAERAYRLARASLDSPTSRFFLGVLHLDALRLGGELHAQAGAAVTLAHEPMDDAFARAHRALYEGMTAMALGDLVTAQAWLRETTATGATLETTWVGRLGQLWLTTVMAMSGDHDGARTVLAVPDPSGRPDRFTHEFAIASSWVHAAHGATSEAIAIVLDSAAKARGRGRPAQEVMCLQTATQYGDPGGASRLVDLTAAVDGPRVSAAAEHAKALRDADGDHLREVARLYEAFGDRVAAGDAAAQAAVILRKKGMRGAALTATATAQRLAAETGADTPALRTNNTPVPLTGRQREIIALAATGMSNRQIAERLTMSVRTVEGHLFRASQKTGVNSRDELVALLGSGPPAQH